MQELIEKRLPLAQAAFHRYEPKFRWRAGAHASMEAIGGRAANYLYQWLPWTPLRFGVSSEVYLKYPAQDVPKPVSFKAEELLHSALFSPVRYLTGFDPGVFSQAVATMPKLKNQARYVARMQDVLEAAHRVRALQGQVSELQQGVDQIKKGRLFRLFSFLPGMTTQLQTNEQDIEQKNRELNTYTLPVHLMAAAIDAANFEHIDDAFKPDQVRYSRRMLYFHGPLLRSLGHLDVANQFESDALAKLDPESHREISQIVAPLIPVERQLRGHLESVLTQLGVSFSGVEGRVKAVSSGYRKTNIPPKNEQEQATFLKIKGNPRAVKDWVAVRGIMDCSTDDLRAFADLLNEQGGLVGTKVGRYHVTSCTERKDLLDDPTPRGYRAIHLTFGIAGHPTINQFEVQLVKKQDHDAHQVKGASADHLAYKGIRAPPLPQSYVVNEKSEDWIKVHADFGTEAEDFDLFKGATLFDLLYRVQRRFGTDVGAILSDSFSVVPFRGAKASIPLELHEPILDGVTYRVNALSRPLSEPNEDQVRRLLKRVKEAKPYAALELFLSEHWPQSRA